ncbi:MAG: ABC transporter permease subunit, partial [Deltaproteobacteria bacterium]|nr:ABC transporter permease subunit [Deltaproteobacteria bacterium]
MATIFRKELADYFTSIRIVILFLLVFGASAAGLFASFQGIRSVGAETGFVFLKLFTTSGSAIPSLTTFIALFVPIIGIALGFDAINSERSNGTLSRILSQPIYRDNVINAKFLAGIATLFIMIFNAKFLAGIATLFIMLFATMLIVAGYGLRMIGVPPNSEEIIRLFLYLILTVIYGAFWMGLAILFSVLFRKIATSLLSSIGLWLFFGFFWVSLIVPAIAKTTEASLL